MRRYSSMSPFQNRAQGFTDLQVERPEDPEVALNLGSSHYQMRNYAEADRAFSRAALGNDERAAGTGPPACCVAPKPGCSPPPVPPRPQGLLTAGCDEEKNFPGEESAESVVRHQKHGAPRAGTTRRA